MAGGAGHHIAPWGRTPQPVTTGGSYPHQVRASSTQVSAGLAKPLRVDGPLQDPLRHDAGADAGPLRDRDEALVIEEDGLVHDVFVEVVGRLGGVTRQREAR